MCRKYQLNWTCSCEFAEKSVVFLCPYSYDDDDFGENYNPAKVKWDYEREFVVTEPSEIACFGETYEFPICLNINRGCNKCSLPTVTNDEVEQLDSQLGEESFSSCLFDEEYFKLCARYNHQFPKSFRGVGDADYQEMTEWADLSREELKFLVSTIDQLENFFKKVETYRTLDAARGTKMERGDRIRRSAHFKAISTCTEDYLDFLKWIEPLAMLLAKDSETFFTTKVLPALLTEVPLEGLDEEDRLCNFCCVPFGEEGEIDIFEKCVETPCHHKFGSSCAQRWFVEEEHSNCPMCRKLLPESLYEYPAKQYSVEWIAHLHSPPDHSFAGSREEYNLIQHEYHFMNDAHEYEPRPTRFSYEYQDDRYQDDE